MTETTIPADYDHAADPFVDWVTDQITEGLHELCDGGAPGSEHAPFGSYARPTVDGNVLTIVPNDNPEDWADERRDPDEPWLIDFEIEPEGTYPSTPVVRITVERIA